jgi:hypothetical protein
LFLATLMVFCCVSLPSDSPKTSGDQQNLIASHSEAAIAENSGQPSLPDAPVAKLESSSNTDAITPVTAASISPKSDPLLIGPAKPAASGSYETARQRKIWYGLMAAGHSAAVFDAYTTRKAVSGNYGVEGDPLLRPFAHSNAMYAATQVSPAIMDYLGHRMMTSNHQWMRRLWWVPQVAGTSLSLCAGVHNSRLVP